MIEEKDKVIDVVFEEHDNLELFLDDGVIRYAIEDSAWEYPCQSVIRWTTGTYDEMGKEPVHEDVHDHVNDDDNCPMCRMIELYYEHEVTA